MNQLIQELAVAEQLEQMQSGLLKIMMLVALTQLQQQAPLLEFL